MSEKINQLEEQAYDYAVIQSYSGEHSCRIGSDYFENLKKKKFVELIIQECIDICHDVGDYAGASCVAAEIEKRFKA